MDNVATAGMATAGAESYAPQDGLPVNAPVNNIAQETGQDWRSMFSPEYQQALGRYKCADDLIKTTISAQTLLGKRNDQWRAEDAESYRAVMGVGADIPANANDYNIDVFKENALDETSMNVVKNASQLMGLTQEQAQKFYEFCHDVCVTDMQAHADEQQMALQNCGEILSTLWGRDYLQQLRAVEICAEQIFPQITGMSAEQIENILDSTNSRQNPLLLAAMSFIGNMMMESGSPGYAGTSPMDANIDLQAMQSDKELMNKMLNVWDPRSASLRQEFYKRIEQKNNTM